MLIGMTACPTRRNCVISAALAAQRTIPLLCWICGQRQPFGRHDGCLRIRTSALSLGLEQTSDHASAVRAVAAFPTIVAAHWRLLTALRPSPLA
ncbi:MAG: hypothetical protein H6672_20715 [Anaerolineaceae bacterium]|nr:hypothetical protein [Anaerolineaceae bacterium]